MSKLQPKVGIACIVMKDQNILVGLRKGNHGGETWGLPGGKLEFGEEIEDCVKRGVEEETTLKVKNIRFGDVTNDIFKETNQHYVTIFMLCEYESGKVRVTEPDKAVSWHWCKWDEIPTPMFLPLKHLVDKGFNPFT